MLEVILCSLVTILPDYLFRRFAQGKRIGKEITFFSVWYELRYGITACFMLTIALITVVFFYHPSTSAVIVQYRTVPILPDASGRVEEVYVGISDRVEAGDPLFRLDTARQEAVLETQRRAIAETDAAMIVAAADLSAAEGRVAEAGAARRRAQDDLETRQALVRSGSNAVATREIETLEADAAAAQGALSAAEFGARRCQRAAEHPAARAEGHRRGRASSGRDRDRECHRQGAGRRPGRTVRPAPRRGHQPDPALGWRADPRSGRA